MCGSGADPIANDELLYRKIPKSKLTCLVTEAGVEAEAFAPGKHDTTGLSFLRAKLTPIGVALQGRSKFGYVVAVLPADALRKAGIPIEPKPEQGLPGHAEITGLSYGNRHADRCEEWKDLLARSVLWIEPRSQYPHYDWSEPSSDEREFGQSRLVMAIVLAAVIIAMIALGILIAAAVDP
ncbi:MAG: hypothetical protein WD847_10300 [Pirellulales bacterium]